MSKYVLDIPNWQPCTLNELLRSVKVRIRRKKQDRQLVYLYAKNAGIPLAEGKRRVKLTITLGPRQRGPDPDSFWKSALDALVCAGLLVDDGRKWVETMPVEYERAKQKSTRIELEDLPSEPPTKRRKT